MLDAPSFRSDPAYFSPLSSSTSNSKALSENWVLRFNNLKRLYKLLIRYFECVYFISSALSAALTRLLPRAETSCIRQPPLFTHRTSSWSRKGRRGATMRSASLLASSWRWSFRCDRLFLVFAHLQTTDALRSFSLSTSNNTSYASRGWRSGCRGS